MKKASILSLLFAFFAGIAYSQKALEAGTYYIQNEEAGTFLSSGANWGTRAVLSPHGVDIKVSVINGQYNLVTQIQGADKALRPSDGYMDQDGTWTLEPLSDGTYAMYNGTNYFGYVASNASSWVPRLTFTDTSTKATHWRFWTKEQLTSRLSSATKDHPVDATFFIQAPDFLIGDYRVTDTKVWGPDLTSTGGNVNGDSYLRNCAVGERYDSPSFDISQKLEGLPNGIYSLSVQGFYRYGSHENASAAYKNHTEQLLPYLYAGDKKVSLPSLYSLAKTSATGGWTYNTSAGYVPDRMWDAAACFDSGEDVYRATITDIVVVDGKLTIGVKKLNQVVQYDWTCIDNFTLMYHGHDMEDMRAAALNKIDEYAALNTTSDSDFSSVISVQRQAVENATTLEELSNALDAVETAYKFYATKAEPTDKPLDFTDLIIRNGDLKNGTTGWEALAPGFSGSNAPWATYNSTTTGLSLLETYAGLTSLNLTKFSLLQDIPLSPGIYRLKGYAFYRYQGSYNSDITTLGDEISNAFMVAGDKQQKVMRLGDLSFTTYANSMSEAAGVFNEGNYLNTLVFEVTEPQMVTIGYTGEHTAAMSWFICGPFVLEKINEAILANEAEIEFANVKKTYVSKWESYKKITIQADEHAAIDQAINEAKTAAADITSQEQLDAKDSEVWSALCDFLRTATSPSGQFDITMMVNNSTFASNYNGWTTASGIVWSDAGLVEMFNKKTGELSQTLKKMPAGSYTLKAQTFYRMTSYRTSNQNYESGNDQLAASLFFGDVSIPVRSINDDSRYRPSRADSDVEGAFGKTIPNTLNGANNAFKANRYWNILRADLAVDSDVTLGVRCEGGQSSNWIPVDNFKLYYGPKVKDVTLNRMDKFEIQEDMYANLTTDIELKAGQLNSLCVPFDLDVDQFESVWTIAGINYDATNKTMDVTLAPTREVKAGTPCFVKVASDMTLKANDIILRAAEPDSIPVMWEGGSISGTYGRSTLTRTYRLSDDGTQMEYTLVKLNVPGYITTMLMPTAANGKVKSGPVNELDFSNMDITVNLENYMARDFLAAAKYPTLTSSSVIESYNTAPPARRDSPHTVLVPVPYNNIPSILEYSQTEDFKDFTTLHIPAYTTVVEVANLTPQQTYYYRIIKGKDEVSKGQIHTEGNLRMIKVPSGSNVRDLGGWLTLDGNHVNYGLVYRGGEMNGGHVMNETDRNELLRLGIGAEVDLRQDIDFTSNIFTKSCLGDDVSYIYLNQSMFGDDALDQDYEKYAKIFPFILNSLRKGRSVYFHCIWGADRTGALAFLLEGLIGLPMDQLFKDYELTTYSIAGLRKKDGLDTKLTYISNLSGKTLQEKFFTYWRDKVGIDSVDLLEFIERMTNGTPSIMTGIDAIGIDAHNKVSGTPVYYTLDGRRTESLQKGINIVKMPDGSVKKVYVNKQ